MRGTATPLGTTLTGALAALAGTVLLAAPARAAEWRYCYAFDAAARRFAQTEPFATNEASPALEAALRRHLAEPRPDPKVDAKPDSRPDERAGPVATAALRTACPRADTREALVLIRRAAGDYQREQHNAVVPLEWSPAEAVARR